MITEAVTGLGALGVIPLGLAALCALGFFWFIRSNVVIGLSLAILGAGVLTTPVILNIKSAQSNRPFAVVVVNDQLSETGFLHKTSVNDGEYTSPAGRIVPLQRSPDWPRSVTLIVNDSNRLVTVRRYHYASSPSVSAGTPLIQVVFPWEQAVMAGYSYAMEDEGTPPPQSIGSSELLDMIDIIYRSTEPYDSTLHGTKTELITERDILK